MRQECKKNGQSEGLYLEYRLMSMTFSIARVFTLVSCLLFLGFSAAAQFAIRGQLADPSGAPVNGATVRLESKNGKIAPVSAVTNTSGGFRAIGLVTDSFTITITHIGYTPISKTIFISENTKTLEKITIQKGAKSLDEVSVTSTVAPTQQKGDTVQFNASQFKVNSDATAEDLLKKMPSVTVDRAGTVTAQGEQVRKVTVDGKDFFGDDATAALRNLPAEVIDKIQVFDRLSDQAQFTGFDDGNSVKALNIVTKANMRNGQFGRIYAGYGTDDRYAAGGNASFLKGNRRISLVGLFNNINQQNFSSQDLLGVTSAGGNSGGGRGRGGGGRPGGNTGNFQVGQQNGISTTNATGINYSDQWGKKWQVSASYFFNDARVNNDQRTATQFFLNNGSSQFADEGLLSFVNNQNHRFNARLEYTIDKSNSLIITPNVSFQRNRSENDNSTINFLTPTDLISESDRLTNRNSKGFNISNSILWRHQFAKRGRTLSTNLTTGINRNEGATFLRADNLYYKTLQNINDSVAQFTDQLTNGKSISVSFVYTEPFGKEGQLQLNYTPSYTVNDANQEVFGFDFVNTNGYTLFDPTLSNVLDNRVTTHNAGVTYRKGNRDNMFSIGTSFQHTGLNSDQTFPVREDIRKPFNNILPNLMWRKKLSAKANIRLFYRASTNVPSVNQLQNVFNNLNPLFITTGNPDLKQQYTHTLTSRYTYTNTQKGTSFFANVFLQQTSDFITNATFVASSDSVLTPTVTLFRGSQLSKPVNLNGFLSVRSFLTYGMPLKFIKSNMNINAGWTYARTPGLVNGVKSISDNYNYSSGVVIASNISEWVDFNVNYNININRVRNNLQPQLNANFITQAAGLQLNLLSKSGWLFQNDVTNNRLTGLTGGFNQNFWLWNMSVGKKFLKNQVGELKVSVFDLLKQNVSIVRNVTENFIEDQRNLVLQQYFMLTFTYKLKSFGLGALMQQNSGGAPGQVRPGGTGGVRPF